jgi:hypothetical protein
MSVTLCAQNDSAQYTITTMANPNYGGTVSGSAVYQAGAVATVQASPNSGFVFTGWFINGMITTLDTSFTFAVTSDLTLQANFFPLTDSFMVAANILPANAGTVTGTGLYKAGDTAHLKAHANPGYAFNNWQVFGIVADSDTDYTFVVTSNIQVAANFSLLPTMVEVSTQAYPAAGGTTTGSGFYFTGDTVHLLAQANEGYTFANWLVNGIITSSDTLYSFVAQADIHLHANFIANPVFYSITANAVPFMSGTVYAPGMVMQGDTATIIAFPEDNFTFDYWEEADTIVTYDSRYTFVAESDRTFIAHFSEVLGIDYNNTFSLLVSPNPCNGICYLQADDTYSIRVLDIGGREVNAISITAGNNRLEFDEPGLYLIQFTNKKGKTDTRKLIVTR